MLVGVCDTTRGMILEGHKGSCKVLLVIIWVVAAIGRIIIRSSFSRAVVAKTMEEEEVHGQIIILNNRIKIWCQTRVTLHKLKVVCVLALTINFSKKVPKEYNLKVREYANYIKEVVLDYIRDNNSNQIDRISISRILKSI